MRRNWRTNRVIILLASLFLCVALIASSVTGVIGPLEGVASTPLLFITKIFNQVAKNTNTFVGDLGEIQNLRQRVNELEEALAQLQPEIVTLREINNDYRRLSEFFDYSSTALNQETIVAEVINYDPNGLLKTIIINKGAREGITRGMPVVTREGLVGRIIDVFANASQVLLVTDSSSFVSARLQTSRAQGSVVGLVTGNLRMIMIPLDASVQEGDIVLTSGMGGNFPPDIPIGQVTSKRQFEFELNQQAEVRSLINFDTLEFVMVITNFQPVDISAFDLEG